MNLTVNDLAVKSKLTKVKLFNFEHELKINKSANGQQPLPDLFLRQQIDKQLTRVV